MKQLLPPFTLFFLFSAIYLYGSFEKIPFGDCVGFVLDIEKEEFVQKTTSTAHFLYINTGILLTMMLPLESWQIAAYLSAGSAAIVVAILFLIIKSLGISEFLSFVSCMVFGLSFSFWRNAEIPEVYTYNLIYVSLYILFSILLIQTRKEKYLILASLALGISYWVHIQNILFVPAYVYLLFKYNSGKKNVFSALGLHTILFLSLFFQPYFSGTGLQYVFKSGSWVENSVSKPLSSFLTDPFIAIFTLFYNFWHFTLLGVVGIFYFIKKSAEAALFLILSGIPIFVFATFYEVSDNYVFFIPFNLIFVIFIAYGLNNIKSSNVSRIIPFTVILIPMFYYLSYNIGISTNQGQRFHEIKAYKGGLAYYTLPWMNNNIGIIDFTLGNIKAKDETYWMTQSADELIKLLLKKGYSKEFIEEL